MASCRLLLVLLVFAQCFFGEALAAGTAESSTRPHASTRSTSPRTHPAGSTPPPTLQSTQPMGDGTETAMFTTGLPATAPPASSTEPPPTSQVAASTGHGAAATGQRTASTSQGASSTSPGAEYTGHGSMPTAGPTDKESPLTQKPGLITVICIFLIILFIGAVVILVKCWRTRDPGFQKLDEVPMGNVTEGSPIARYPRK